MPRRSYFAVPSRWKGRTSTCSTLASVATKPGEPWGPRQLTAGQGLVRARIPGLDVEQDQIGVAEEGVVGEVAEMAGKFTIRRGKCGGIKVLSSRCPPVGELAGAESPTPSGPKQCATNGALPPTLISRSHPSLSGLNGPKVPCS
jgi:hypothetical protein